MLALFFPPDREVPEDGRGCLEDTAWRKEKGGALSLVEPATSSLALVGSLARASLSLAMFAGGAF